MCDVKIGRAQVTTDHDVNVSTANYDGDKVKLTAWVVGTAVEVTRVVEMLRAYQTGADESVVPVVCTCGIVHLTGFYRVTGLSVGQVKTERAEMNIDLERVHGFAAPICESILQGGQRATSNAGLVTGVPWHAVPAATVGYETGQLTPTTKTFVTETGDVSYFYEATPSTPPHFYNARPAWFLAPGSWYAGAATLTVGGDLVAGLQAPNNPTAVVVSNGIVRLTGGAGGTITTELWSGTAWGTAGAWKIGRKIGPPYTTDPLGVPHTLTVIRNDPACVTIRLSYDAAALIPGSRFAVNLDCTLRRGSSVVEVTLATRGNYLWGFQSPIVYASLVNANDSTTDGTFIACGTADLSQQPVDLKSHFNPVTAATQFDQWGWGYLNGQTQAFMAAQYAAAQVERIQVVAR